MLTSNLIHRTFQIRVNDATATCFTIDRDGRQYLITAQHVVRDVADQSHPQVELFHDGQWKPIILTLVGHCTKPVDISVYAPPQQLSPPLRLPPQDKTTFGQPVYFLGFPYGLRTNLGELNRNFPAPFIKQAIVSSMDNECGTCFYLDGHNNPGFSGGPVIAHDSVSDCFALVSVVSGYQSAPENIHAPTGPVDLHYQADTGIIISYGIKHALDVISDNPNGFEITA